MSEVKPCCGDYENCVESCTPRGQWIATEALLNRKDTQTYFNGIPETIYTVPPKREWVGLTESEIVELAGGGITRDERMIARAIEAKLKEKNGG